MQVLGGSWVVISGVISKVTIVITHIRGLITILITTHEPPSRGLGSAPKPEALTPGLDLRELKDSRPFVWGLRALLGFSLGLRI